MSIKSQTHGGSSLPSMESQRAPNYMMAKEAKKMPLISGEKAKTKKGFSANVKAEMEAGKPQNQSVAIAYSKAREHKSSGEHRHKEHR